MLTLLHNNHFVTPVNFYSCNSPLSFVIEVLTGTTQETEETEQLLSQTLDNLKNTNATLEVDGETIDIRFSGVKSSTDIG